MPRLNLNLIYFAPCGLYQGIGGGARLKNMVHIFEKLGVNIQLISYISQEDFKIKHEKTSDLLNTITVHIPRSLPKFLKVFAIPLILMYGLKYIKKSDIVFAHSPGMVSGFPAMVLAKIFNKPLIIDHMDVGDSDTPMFIQNYVLKSSTIVFAISHYLEKEVREMGCRNVAYLPIFIDTDVFQRDVFERKKMREKMKIRDKEILIGYAGSFWYGEGVPLLLKAFKNLVKRYENIRLIIIGGTNAPGLDNISPLIDELLIKEKVTLVPPQPHDFIPKYLSACDIVCSPKTDCIGNIVANPIKIYEYMSMGLITVISAVGEVSSVIENGVNGFLVKPGDEGDLERALEYIIQNIDSLEEVGKKARMTTIERYSYEAIENTIKQAISEIIDVKKGNKNNPG